jgi:glyoxylase-like metal-dependent hydrolase (beta-lactamase superfamily II)
MEKVAENIYRIRIPLTVPLLDSMNAYVIRDPERSLIVDTGMMQTQCRDAMAAGLSEVGIDLESADFFMTHHHGDHFGLVSLLLTKDARIYINRLEADLVARIASRAILADVSHFIEITGFPESDLQRLIPSRAGAEYQGEKPWPFAFIEDGDIINKGGHQFECIVTPGHSRGHTCLYDKEKGILISGDHILHNITPAIQLRSDDENPLGDYLTSLDKLYGLEVGLGFPGHGHTLPRYRTRLDEMRRHHEERAAEVLAALVGGGKDVYQVASLIPWSIVDFEGWEGVPLLQKFFATGEAFSHLKYLEERNQVKKHLKDGRFFYSLIPSVRDR